MNMNKKLLLIAISSLLLNLPAYADRAETVEQNDYVRQQSAAETTFLGKGTEAYTVNIPELKIDLTSAAPGVIKSGSIYTLPQPVSSKQIYWEKVSGGYVARIRLQSNQAKRLRYHVAFDQPILSIKFRVKGSKDAQPLEPVDFTKAQGNDIWLPVTNGSDAELEVFVDETTPPEATFAIDAVNVIVVDKNAGINLKSLGVAEYPETDVACANPSAKLYTAIQKAASATALVHFTKPGDSGSYLCTGTLLADKSGSKIPFFATANHCLSTQASADTAAFEWFYQATTCDGSTTDSRHVQTSGGGKLLWTEAKSEASLLKLNAQPPNGVAFMGWDDTPFKVGDSVAGIHHPAGDHTMISVGQVTKLAVSPNFGDDIARELNQVTYAIGGTEGGSSGSGVFMPDTSGNNLYWKGTLSGGPESNYHISYYSDFNKYYSNIKQWLSGAASAGNSDIENYYNRYPTFFGTKSGGNYACYSTFTCQRFVNNKIIAAHNTNHAVFWSDGTKWYQGK